MTGFEPGSSDIVGDRSANCATTTSQTEEKSYSACLQKRKKKKNKKPRISPPPQGSKNLDEKMSEIEIFNILQQKPRSVRRTKACKKDSMPLVR